LRFQFPVARRTGNGLERRGRDGKATADPCGMTKKNADPCGMTKNESKCRFLRNDKKCRFPAGMTKNADPCGMTKNEQQQSEQ
jgi:hypothetical protein